MRKSLSEVLRAQPKLPESELIFPTLNGNVRWNNWDKELKSLLAKADIRNPHEITAHSFRHSFISQLLSYGKQDIKIISHLVGHKNPTTTQGYVHLLGGMESNLASIETLPDYSTFPRDI